MLVTTVGNNEIHSVYRSIGITNDMCSRMLTWLQYYNLSFTAKFFFLFIGQEPTT